ncbi:hypothetical protein VNI00_009588 [Paramarasmius palmivorus]|uniref:DUF4283 domain-containing protein n=1 Tax=Paramarasmius palmivorus TaxID=297713 RepID=A0AAW0CQF4_9AGAR
MNVRASVDDGAMVPAIDEAVYREMKDKIGGWRPSSKWFRVANGALVPGVASWTGKVRIKGVEVIGTFEVFDSGGSWKILFGKPLLKQFRAIHDYEEDSIKVRDGKNIRKVFNSGMGKVIETAPKAVKSVTVEEVEDEEENPATRQHKINVRDNGGVPVNSDTPRSREVNHNETYLDMMPTEYPIPPVTRRTDGQYAFVFETPQEFKERRQKEDEEIQEKLRRRKEEEQRKKREEARMYWKMKRRGKAGRRWYRWKTREQLNAKERRRIRILWKKRANSMGGSHAPPLRGVSINTDSESLQNTNANPELPQILSIEPDETMDMSYGKDIIPDSLDQANPEQNIFTRNEGENGAFKEKRVEEILRQVTIGSSLTPEEKQQAEDLIREFADNFTLSVSEVRLVKDVVHKLNVPEGAKMKKKIAQKRLTPPQQEYLHSKIDELIAAGVIEQCTPDEVKCVSPTTLAKKST